MPVVIDVGRADDPRDVVHRAVQALAEGHLVAFPTETVYGIAASARHEEAVQKLAALRRDEGPAGFTLAVRSADESLDYFPGLSPLGERLARRCWPGPLTLVVENASSESLFRRLPQGVQSLVAPGKTLAMRVPAHSLIHSALRLAVGPLVLTAVAKPDRSPATTAAEVVQQVGDKVSLVLDDGPTRFGQYSSVIRVDGHEYEIQRAGVLTEPTLQRLASYMVLFVCTGNTCRSPMAEALMRRRAMDKLSCQADELPERGLCILSAGVAAMAGSRASQEAHQAVTNWGADLNQHESQPVTDRLVRFADLILTMTRAHREALLAQWPEAASRTKLLSRNSADVADPIGGPIELYRRCAEQIDSHLAAWADDIDWSRMPTLRRSRPAA